MNRILLIVLLFLITACAPQAIIPNRDANTQKLTLGFVQSRIKAGTTGDEVVSILGSPNIITSNSDGSETWVYDKVATEYESAVGFATATYVSSTRTMIVVIKYGLDRKVKEVSYRQTSY